MTYESRDDLAILEVPINEERPWMVFSACRDADPNLFFATGKADVDRAMALCRACPVRSECLDYALEARERFGIWGGTTDKQRRRLLRKSA